MAQSQVPALPIEHLSRPHLVSAALSRRIGLLIAPAGYGKTVLLSETARAAQGRVVYYRVDEGDRDPAVLAAGLARALGAPGTVGALGRWLAEQPGSWLIVLDRLELLAGAEAACQCISDLLGSSPERVQILLAGRTLPAIPGLARLRVAGEVVEIGARSLLLTAEESRALLGAPAAAEEEAGGWGAALRLLCGPDGPDWAEFFRYVEAEVVSALSPEALRCLTDLAIATEWSGALSRWLAESADAEQLVAEGLRLLPVDRDGRLHPLVRRYFGLRLQREPERLRRLHRRAALWAIEQEEAEMGLAHALAAADLGLAMRLLQKVGGRLLAAGRLAELEALCTQVEPSMLEAAPRLMLQVGEALRRGGRLRGAVALLRAAAVGFAAAGESGGLLRAFCRQALAHSDLGEWEEMQAALGLVEQELGEAVGLDRAEALRALAVGSLAREFRALALAQLREAAALFAAHGDLEGAGLALVDLAKALIPGGCWGEALEAVREAQRLLSGALATEAYRVEEQILLEQGRAVEGAKATDGLRVECLGAFRVFYNGEEVPAVHWGRAQVRAVLQCLLLQPGYAVTREFLLESFWPDTPPAQSRGRLRVVLNRLRQALQALGCRLEADTAVIRLPREAIAWFDLLAFREHLAAARRLVTEAPESCLEHCRSGRQLYRGPLLSDLYWSGVEEHRNQVYRELLELLQLWHEAAVRAGRTEEAITALEELVALEPGQEEAAAKLVTLLIQVGRRGEALRRYRELVRWLKVELGLDPTLETQALVRQALN